MRRIDPLPLPSLLMKLERGTLEHWRKDRHNGHSLEASLSKFLVSVETSYRRAAGGHVSVSVAVIDKDPVKCMVSYFELTRKPGGLYEVADAAISLE